MDIKLDEWNKSYEHRDNVLFYPHEEIIRFVSKYLRKRTGIDEFLNIRPNFKKVLDLGCGAGRHVFYLDEIGFEAYGIDLSNIAINYADAMCNFLRKPHLASHFTIGDITDMKYDSNTFDFMVSHGVLDSMRFSIALSAMQEAARVLKKGGLFYLDLIMNSDFSDIEVTVDTKHEYGTIQSYFNDEKINRLLGESFNVLDFTIIEGHRRDMSLTDRRAHLVVERL